MKLKETLKLFKAGQSRLFTMTKNVAISDDDMVAGGGVGMGDDGND